ncbi:hypothetical protein PC129_g12897 [Phytophthora cactorum]|uniref:Uncharacterized protein n=1 Tax=Phytophthora cactorum TaxID=29920 RepID=A0A329RPI1_9STRA|nr:hypothetical protein Pcac1_g18245 [Phytophthora cactorum]KAG2803912.1 hypothetical protein PC111_g18487 [Phytophthora cactorum]KAG2810283.1 hypothetical protein PC112_g16122 [Phytophthora cactorum]KAG2851059.1 hypothetical protein PC113_g16240 [Phytophthora cactorum]KAG2894351.1 hypothetical protein PC114_g15947 [Phytophthora cactorum]
MERKEARRLASKQYYWRKKAGISWFDLYGKTSKRFPSVERLFARWS